MKRVFEEFRTFLSRGNVIDMAVGVIIGAAFKAIVDSLTNDIISPLIGLIVNIDLNELAFHVGEVAIGYGAFLTAIINFFIIGLVLFLIVRGFNRLHELTEKKPAEEEPKAPTTKICPFCKSEISIEATRCPHCTSELDK